MSKKEIFALALSKFKEALPTFPIKVPVKLADQWMEILESGSLLLKDFVDDDIIDCMAGMSSTDYSDLEIILSVQNNGYFNFIRTLFWPMVVANDSVSGHNHRIAQDRRAGDLFTLLSYADTVAVAREVRRIAHTSQHPRSFQQLKQDADTALNVWKRHLDEKEVAHAPKE